MGETQAGSISGMVLTSENQCLGDKSLSVPLCQPEIPYRLLWVWFWTSALSVATSCWGMSSPSALLTGKEWPAFLKSLLPATSQLKDLGLLDSEDRDSSLPRNVSNSLPIDRTSYTRRLESSSVLWRPQILPKHITTLFLFYKKPCVFGRLIFYDCVCNPKIQSYST